VSTSAAIQDHLSIFKCLAIDGPTAVGKSVIGKALAISLELFFCDTGLMYRAATLAVLRSGIEISDQDAIFQCVEASKINLAWKTKDAPLVIMDGEDVSSYLRDPAIDSTVSKVAELSRVRSVLVEQQRKIADESPVVMVGRDIGTFILPEARTKIFLTASLEERARRRQGDEVNAGRNTKYEEVRKSISTRDAADNTGHRAITVEQAAKDAKVVDTDSLSIIEVVDQCIALYRKSNLV